jgi:hypothetical protein
MQSETEEDAMKLAIHGLLDHSDHDRQDWEDALSVVSATLNPIALRRAHILEELARRRRKKKATENVLLDEDNAVAAGGSVELEEIGSRMATHGHRDRIICLGYNEMLTAVLALADATSKELVVVEYDPMKITALKNQYGVRKQQQQQHRRGSSSPTGSGGAGGDEESDQKKLRGVVPVYADVHDPECWEELEMDEAFVIVCTMRGARHAEKALVRWLRKKGSKTIFIACSDSNADAQLMYDAGAHFVMQTDALAMRATRDIFMETVANVGDCTQLVIAGAAHSRRLRRLRKEYPKKFQYET